MILSAFRFFLRLIVLVLSVFSILYFYVLWYKFEPEIWFIKTSNYDLENYSPYNSKVLINWKKYFLNDWKIILSNMFSNKNCGELQIWNFKKYYCFEKKNNHIVYISKNYIKIIPSKNKIFKNLDLIKTENSNIKYKFTWNNITFYYYRNGDIIYKDDVSSKKLINFPNIEFVWYDRNGFFIVKNNKLLYFKINNNDIRW